MPLLYLQNILFNAYFLSVIFTPVDLCSAETACYIQPQGLVESTGMNIKCSIKPTIQKGTDCGKSFRTLSYKNGVSIEQKKINSTFSLLEAISFRSYKNGSILILINGLDFSNLERKCTAICLRNLEKIKILPEKNKVQNKTDLEKELKETEETGRNVTIKNDVGFERMNPKRKKQTRTRSRIKSELFSINLEYLQLRNGVYNITVIKRFGTVNSENRDRKSIRCMDKSLTLTLVAHSQFIIDELPDPQISQSSSSLIGPWEKDYSKNITTKVSSSLEATISPHRNIENSQNSTLQVLNFLKPNQLKKPSILNSSKNTSSAISKLTYRMKQSNLSRRGVDERYCVCRNCIKATHEYLQEFGVLRFFYTFKEKSCTDFTARLYKYKSSDSISSETCENLNTLAREVIHNLRPVATHLKPILNPIELTGLDTGCYVMRISRANFYGFFWVEADKVQYWNTSIAIIARNFNSSVEVRWTQPEYPYNFSMWSLSLWYVKESKVHCTGKNSKHGVVSVFQPPNFLSDTFYTFWNLTEGFYCVRITPIDERCHSNSCFPRSSYTIQLMSYSNPTSVSENSMSFWIIGPIIVAGVLLGVVLAFILYLFGKKSLKPSSGYAALKMGSKMSSQNTKILLIWTKRNAKISQDYEEIVSEFKSILQQFNIEVKDYLDLNSLNSFERQTLLNSPVEWLRENLSMSNQKIVFIGSNSSLENSQVPIYYPNLGTKMSNHPHQKTLENGTKESDQIQKLENIAKETIYRDKSQCTELENETKEPIYQDENQRIELEPLDQILFPHAVRYLRDSMNLSCDYSRIFVVKFEGMQNMDSEDDIVPWVRFYIPKHVTNLINALKGSIESGLCIKQVQLNNLQNLVQKYYNSPH